MTIAHGDIAFTGFNADGNDGFSIVTLKNIAAGEVVVFTDNEWSGTAFNAGEGVLTWTTTSAVQAGTVVVFNNTSTLLPTVSHGLVAGTPMDLAAQNDMVWAVTGSLASPITFLGVIANSSGGNFENSPLLTNTGLTTSTGALIFGSNDDVLEYNGPTSGDAATLFAALSNTANFLSDNGGGDQSNDGNAAEFPGTVGPFSLTVGNTVTNTTSGATFGTLQEGFNGAAVGDVFDIDAGNFPGASLTVTRVDGLQMNLDDYGATDHTIIVVATGANSFTHTGSADMHIRLTNASRSTQNEGSKSATTGSGDDIVRAHRGDNVIDTGAGNDIVYSGQHDDTINGGDGDDFLHGQQDDDTIYGDDGTDRLFGDQGDDDLHGGAGDDTLVGDQGADFLSGGLGHDRIFLGKANQQGDGDADIVRFDKAELGQDRVWGFEDGVDTLEISGAADLSEFLFTDDAANNRVIVTRTEDGAPTVATPWVIAVYDMTAATLADDIVLI